MAAIGPESFDPFDFRVGLLPFSQILLKSCLRENLLHCPVNVKNILLQTPAIVTKNKLYRQLFFIYFCFMEERRQSGSNKSSKTDIPPSNKTRSKSRAYKSAAYPDLGLNNNPPLIKTAKTTYDLLKKRKANAKRIARLYRIESGQQQEAKLEKTPVKDIIAQRIQRSIKSLTKRYGVKVETVATNDEFHSPETMARTIKEGVYFISKEDPVASASISSYLIKFTKLRSDLLLSEPNDTVKATVDLRDRSKLLLELAKANRTEQTNRLSAELGQRIIKIAEEYKHDHNDKKPSMNKIAKILTSRDILTPGGEKNWAAVTVSRIIERNKLEL